MNRMSKESVIGFYLILIVVLALIGYFVGKSKGNEAEWSLGGAALGVVLSVVSWFAWGKNNTY